ncbi:MAG: hypothetical protein AAGD96_26145, partial [Chloroflexota bacterium]
RGYILVKEISKGLPVRAVNLETADLKVIQVNDRNLVPQMAQGGFEGQGELYPGEVEQYRSQVGVEIWDGQVDLPAGKANASQDSQIPLADLIGTPEPGLYLAVARNSTAGRWDPWASQWFLVSDIGLTSFKGELKKNG